MAREATGCGQGADGWEMYLSGIYGDCSKDAVIDHAVTLSAYGKDESTLLPCLHSQAQDCLLFIYSGWQTLVGCSSFWRSSEPHVLVLVVGSR